MPTHKWTSHMSKTYNREYWHNRETKKSVWVKPQEVIDYEKEKEEQEEKKRKEKEEQRKIWKKREEEFFREHEKRVAAREKAEKESYGMQIVNGNGMSWTIEGGAHWTKEDYMEELRNYNQALRDF